MYLWQAPIRLSKLVAKLPMFLRYPREIFPCMFSYFLAPASQSRILLKEAGVHRESQ